MHRSLTEQSRKLRKEHTLHEKKLWSLLRDRNFEGVKFRRQHEISPYIADFCCIEKKLVIELDGGGHDDGAQRRKDVQRDEYLKAKGWVVLRIWNSEMDQNLEGVLDHLYNLVRSPSPLSPKGEGVSGDS